jgi:hypothetical protein
MFWIGKQNIGSVRLAGGKAYLNTSALPVGKVEITASYSGDSTFAPSTSTSILLTISGPDFSVEANPGTVSTTLGESVNVALLITPKNGFNQIPQLSCSGLPSGATCTFAKPAKQPDGTSLVTMTIQTDSSAAHLRVPGSPEGSSRAPIAWALLPLVLCLSSRRRKEFRRLVSLSLLVLAVIFGSGAIGCGGRAGTGSTKPSDAASTIKVTVTAKTTTGLIRTADIQLNLK